jgi:hypothetical protein
MAGRITQASRPEGWRGVCSQARRFLARLTDFHPDKEFTAEQKRILEKEKRGDPGGDKDVPQVSAPVPLNPFTVKAPT